MLGGRRWTRLNWEKVRTASSAASSALPTDSFHSGCDRLKSPAMMTRNDRGVEASSCGRTDETEWL